MRSASFMGHNLNNHEYNQQFQKADNSAERMRSAPLNLNNNNNHNEDHNEYDHHSQDYRHSLSFLHDRQSQYPSSFNNNENIGAFDFPISTARSTSMSGGGGQAIGQRLVGGSAGGGKYGGGQAGDGGAGVGFSAQNTYENLYGSMSSRLEPMLLPSIGSTGQQQSTAAAHMQQSSNNGLQLSSSIGGNSQLPHLHDDMDGSMMHEADSYLQNMESMGPPNTLPNHHSQEPTFNRYSSHNPFPTNGQVARGVSSSKSAFTPEGRGQSQTLSAEQNEPLLTGDKRQNDYLIHSQDHRKKFLGASSSQVFVKWLDEESGGMNPSSHLKHGMTSAEEMILPGQLELCHHPLPSQPELETYVSTYFRTFHILYPVLEESWLRSQLARSKGPQTAGGDFATPAVVYLVISLGASMTSSSHASLVSKTYLDQAWKALPVILGRPFRSSVQALVLMAVALRLVSSG